ncbi:hypothetical protein LQ938_08755 [Microbacterium sp. cx-55]|uniref:hypothetical protein n=1 Tax=unclassified Microbacterium TaxID=2609290 RepID=UPI001CBCB52C|nr:MULTISPECIES: hypothetical protein [unclassified Microbacterium]MBZ4486149.1 hypothetical protein [Microbacterium sp. cx-55]MCC4907140.1 hypothetical protein [Microbacterium sp. cx-59]UGB33980.1 hypothetical protein LQ938_08755 [Microbacterium sp. cx-55]
MSRPRRRARSQAPRNEDSFDRLLAGWKRSEFRRGAEWTVQPISAAQAAKVYTCPGCGGQIAEGTAHLVVWRADGVLGDAADLAARRHWHTHCWKVH